MFAGKLAVQNVGYFVAFNPMSALNKGFTDYTVKNKKLKSTILRFYTTKEGMSTQRPDAARNMRSATAGRCS